MTDGEGRLNVVVTIAVESLTEGKEVIALVDRLLVGNVGFESELQGEIYRKGFCANCTKEIVAKGPRQAYVHEGTGLIPCSTPTIARPDHDRGITLA